MNSVMGLCLRGLLIIHFVNNLKNIIKSNNLQTESVYSYSEISTMSKRKAYHSFVLNYDCFYYH